MFSRFYKELLLEVGLGLLPLFCTEIAGKQDLMRIKCEGKLFIGAISKVLSFLASRQNKWRRETQHFVAHTKGIRWAVPPPGQVGDHMVDHLPSAHTKRACPGQARDGVWCGQRDLTRKGEEFQFGQFPPAVAANPPNCSSSSLGLRWNFTTPPVSDP